jgi:ubiquinone biosynthesis protein COQ4
MSNTIRPLAALRALAVLSSNPDDLPQVFTVIESLSGGTEERIVRRMRMSEAGCHILAARPDLGARLADRAALHALPRGTLGRVYAEFSDREGITQEGIVEASMRGTVKRSADWADDDMRFMADRLRDMHDLWHVITGYGTDLSGEASLLWFTFAQTNNPGIALLGLLALVKSWAAGIWPVPTMLEGYQRGRRAGWLPALPWEDLLDRPLLEVRHELRIGPPPSYAPVTTRALRARGLLPTNEP